MKKWSVVSALCLGIALASTAVAGDELLEAARREKERRAALDKKRRGGEADRALTNKDLKASTGGTISTVTPHHDTTAPAKGAPSAAAKGGKPEEPKPEGAPATGGAADEELWRQRMVDARSDVDRAKKELEELNQKINDLRRQSATTDDPNIRYQRTQELIAAEASIPVAQKAIADAEKGVSALRDEARRAGVPAGWVR